MLSKDKPFENTELFVFDLDGTIYISDNEIPGAFATVNRLRELGKRICFFTNNSSRNHADYVKKLNGFGLKVSDDEIYTSGQVACEYILQNNADERVFLLGNSKLKAEFESYGVNLVDDNPTMCVLAFDTELTYDKLYRFCQYVNKGAKYVATHPDNFCPSSLCPMPDAGALIEAVFLTIGKRPELVMGKPHTIAGERIEKRFGLPKEKIAMVGDRLYTDVAFGLNCGFKGVLVLTGETTLEQMKNSNIKPDVVLNSVNDILEGI